MIVWFFIAWILYPDGSVARETQEHHSHAACESAREAYIPFPSPLKPGYGILTRSCEPRGGN
jgi:hypothetical protein